MARSQSDDDEEKMDLQNAVSELLNQNPEQVQRITDAATRVAELQMEQSRLADELKRMENESGEEMEARRQRMAEEDAAGMIAEAEMQAAELLLKAAQLQAEDAEAGKIAYERENRMELDRIESLKAGVFSAAGGCLATLPLMAASSSPARLLSSLIIVAGCSFLFGIVYRYVVRSDKENVQLKGGVVSAFGLVRGLSMGQELMEAGTNGYQHWPDSLALGTIAISMGEAMLMFGFCSVVLEYAFSKTWIDVDGS